MDKISAVILAAGSGSRMNSDIPKQYMRVADKPLVVYSMEMFMDSPVDEIVAVVPEGDEQYFRDEIVKRYAIRKVSAVVSGGEERYDSVYRGLLACTGGYVMIHDCARAFVSPDIIARAIECVRKEKACIVAVPSKDTIKIADENGYVSETLKRSALWSVQTPQCFRRRLIMDAYENLCEEDKAAITDDAMIVERATGSRIKIVMGEYTNIKVTTPEDIYMAEQILKAQGRLV